MVSRLTRLKRADLLVQALAQPEAVGIRAVIGGEGEERDRLLALIARLGLRDRVSLAGRLDEETLLGHLANCRAVCFPPLEEDYGFVTPEAFASCKAVITCRDSGGPAELVDDRLTGLVCDPTPQSLAIAMRTLMEDRSLAEKMGGEAHAAGTKLDWSDAVRHLTEYPV
jgi:glycosyltransferase involved in cell wall biosynthesis